MDDRALLQWFRRLLIAAAPAAALSACGCPTTDEVFPISQSAYDANSSPDGTGTLATSVCDQLCVATPDDGGTADGGAPDAGVGRRFFVQSCKLVHIDLDQPAVDCTISFPCLGGRRPVGFAAVADVHRGVGAHFARMACLEAASVPAFRQLALELSAHGAPRRLVGAARRAARDEAVHARAVGALARRYGACPAPVRVQLSPLRSLAEVARDNAAEGKVRETLGAWVTFAQGTLAQDRVVRAAMAKIARDEIAHAALSWRLDGWFRSRLSARDRALVRDAEHATLDVLRAESLAPLPAHARAQAGVPDGAAVRIAIDDLRARLAA